MSGWPDNTGLHQRPCIPLAWISKQLEKYPEITGEFNKYPFLKRFLLVMIFSFSRLRKIPQQIKRSHALSEPHSTGDNCLCLQLWLLQQTVWDNTFFKSSVVGIRPNSIFTGNKYTSIILLFFWFKWWQCSKAKDRYSSACLKSPSNMAFHPAKYLYVTLCAVLGSSFRFELLIALMRGLHKWSLLILK